MKDFKVYQASGYLTKLVTDASDVRKEYEEISGSLVQFDTPLSAPLASLIVDINPVQDLHGQDAPYPAGGGVNKFDEVYPNISTSLSYKPIFVGDGTFTLSTDMPPHTSSSTNLFLLSGNVSSGASSVNNGVWLNKPRTQESNDGYVTIGYRNEGNVDPRNYKTQLEEGSTATPWQPYSNICPITGRTGANIYHSGEDTSNPTVYPVSWQDEAGTVYGGTVDLVSGEMTVTMAEYIFTGEESWNASATPNRFFTYISDRLQYAMKAQSMDANAKQNVISSVFGEFVYKNADGVAYIVTYNDRKQIVINTTAASTTYEIAAIMAGTQLVYELATPIEIQLTSQEISTLIGVNNIWADTGDVSVEYRTH